MKYTKKQNQKIRVLLYTRVSTDDQVEHGFSLDNQIDQLRRECSKRGYEIVEHFQDDGYSATSFKRPAFQNLLTFIKNNKGQIQKILVTKMCRFSRNFFESIKMMEELKRYGVVVATLDAIEESDDPSAFIYQVFSILFLKSITECAQKTQKKALEGL